MFSSGDAMFTKQSGVVWRGPMTKGEGGEVKDPYITFTFQIGAG
jgi:hypothetical protein